MKLLKARKSGGTTQLRERRTAALKRLQEQLKAGKKTVNIILTGHAYEELTPADKNRIEREIETLKSRI